MIVLLLEHSSPGLLVEFLVVFREAAAGLVLTVRTAFLPVGLDEFAHGLVNLDEVSAVVLLVVTASIFHNYQVRSGIIFHALVLVVTTDAALGA